MEANRPAILLAVLTIFGTAFSQCCAAPSDKQQRRAQMIQEISDGQNIISGVEDNLTNNILARMDHLYEQVAKQLDNQSPQEVENARHGRIEMDIEEELKQMMLTKMKEMYDRAI